MSWNKKKFHHNDNLGGNKLKEEKDLLCVLNISLITRDLWREFWGLKKDFRYLSVLKNECN